MDFLRVSENKRYFVRDGAPFFWMGDTIWPAVSWYTLEELETYFAVRAGQGFTVAQIMLPWTMFDGSSASRNASAPVETIPLWLDGDPARPNDEYFEKLDKVIDMAAKHGMLITILPNGGGSGTHVEHKKIITMDNIGAYASWLGKRYKDEPNIVWVNGFDLQPWMHEDLAREFNTALISEDRGNHLIFYHPCGAASSNHFHNEDWLAANFIQTWSSYNSIQQMVTADYHRNPPKPVVHVEGAYEAGVEYTTAPITSWHVREQAWWSYLSGGFHSYGHNDIWRKTPYWRDVLDSRGARQLKILKELLVSLDWWKLIPDQKMIRKSFSEGHAAARSADGDFAVIYFAHRATLTVNVSVLGVGKTVTGEWIDPQDGRRFGKTAFAGPECAITSPAACDDAVLLLSADNP